MAKEAVGLIETSGTNPAICASDAMCKAAGVTMVQAVEIGGGYVTMIVKGDVGSVKAAVDAGAEAANAAGELVAAHVIPQPHDDLLPSLLGG